MEKEHSSSCKTKNCLTEPVRAWSQPLVEAAALNPGNPFLYAGGYGYYLKIKM